MESHHPDRHEIPIHESMDSNASGDPATEGYKIDEAFFFQDIYFMVEEYLYKVPRRNFESGSEVFRDLLFLPVPDGQTPDGFSRGQPLHLEGIKRDDFVPLLRVMFPCNYGEDEALTTNQWVSVLKLASMWQFDAIRAKAIDSLNKRGIVAVDPVRAVALAKEHDIEAWLVPAVNAMAKRDEPVGPEDVAILGLDTALQIAAVREKAVNIIAGYGDVFDRGRNRMVHPSRSSLDFTSTIHAVFQIKNPSAVVP